MLSPRRHSGTEADPKEVGTSLLIFVLVMMGVAIGWLAQFILGRRENWIEALIAATIGSLVGGLLASLLVGDGLQLRPSGPIGSLIGAVLVLWLWGAVRRRA
jgi:uncharacterized membrane protein YeaQ/YmgE (transglycosylase-associated protein family)